MKLTHLPLEQLKLSPLNVRKKGGRDIADLLPLVRRHGIIEPLIVRPNCEGFEIVAGQRRYNCALALKEEGIEEPVPVAIMEDGDDATAIEISLAENISHLPMDEIDQYKAFAGLKAKGLDAAEIAARFGVTERLVNQRLAIAGIIEPVLNAYRRDEIDAGTLRVLTMATPRQQKAWWKLFRSDDDYAPTGHALREWLFGGTQVPVGNALFDVAEYKGAIVADLFGKESYFADAAAFWSLQNAAIAARRDAYLADGWREVVVLDAGQHFAQWNHVRIGKKKGGKVFVATTRDGEVTFHEGFLPEKEARSVKTGSAAAEAARPARPELTKAMQNYLGLHRHAAVRTELLACPGIALRLAAAHMIAGSDLWSISADPQRADNDAIRESLASAQAEAGFAEERKRIRALLGIEDEDGGPVAARSRGYRDGLSLADTFARLMRMDDPDVLRILAYVMAETLSAHTGMVETLGALLGTDMRRWWTPDEIFFDLMRDKEAINAMVREVAGEGTADAHLTSTATVQKKIVGDCLAGTREAQAKDWLPRYMAFPAQGYTARYAGEVEV